MTSRAKLKLSVVNIPEIRSNGPTIDVDWSQVYHGQCCISASSRFRSLLAVMVVVVHCYCCFSVMSLRFRVIIVMTIIMMMLVMLIPMITTVC